MPAIHGKALRRGTPWHGNVWGCMTSETGAGFRDARGILEKELRRGKDSSERHGLRFSLQ